MTPHQQRIYDQIPKKGRMTVVEIAKGLPTSINVRSVRAALNKMAKSGYCNSITKRVRIIDCPSISTQVSYWKRGKK